MKKRFLNSIIYISCLYLVTSCDDIKFADNFLEKAPGADITLDTIFSSRLYAERALNSAYATLRTGLIMSNIGVSGIPYEHQNAHNQLNFDNLDALTDIIQSYCDWGGVVGSYYAGNYSAELENSNAGTKYGYNTEQEAAWSGIRKAYIFIENVDKVRDMSESEKRRRKAEAYIIVASHYSELFRHFGGVPIIEGSIDPANQSNYDFSRKSVEEVLDHIISLCDKAAVDLPWSVTAAEDGRLTRAAAMGLKCRVLLMAASPLFNASAPYMQIGQPTGANVEKLGDTDINKMVWLGGYSQERWERVVKACEEFFAANLANGEAYKLIQANTNTADGYRQAWSKTYGDRNNGEIIISTGRTHRTFGDTYHRYYFGPTMDFNNNDGRGYGGGCITLNFVDMFPYANGERASYADWVNQNNNTGTFFSNPFLNRDPRLYEAVMILGDKFQGRRAQMWIGGIERKGSAEPRAYTGFNNRKFFWDYNPVTFHDKPSNYSYLRLAEIYLIYAEALNETGKTQDAFQALNKIRNRVGLPNISDELLTRLHQGKTLPTYQESSLVGNPRLREEILEERTRELSFEEVRWFDIVRWKREDIFKKDLHRIDIMRTQGVEGNESSYVFSFSQPEVITARYWKNTFSPKWYLSAFPSNEVNKGYGLVQNPGW